MFYESNQPPDAELYRDTAKLLILHSLQCGLSWLTAEV